MLAMAGVVAGTVLALAASPTTSAHADGKVTWYSAAYSPKYYLEIGGQSKSDGAVAGIWGWNGGANQYWVDTKLSDGYYQERNYNSGKNLDGYEDCSVHQYGSSTPNQRRWKELNDGSNGWWIINKKVAIQPEFRLSSVWV